MRAVSRIKLYPGVAFHLKKSLKTWVRLAEKYTAQFVLPMWPLSTNVLRCISPYTKTLEFQHRSCLTQMRAAHIQIVHAYSITFGNRSLSENEY